MVAEVVEGDPKRPGTVANGQEGCPVMTAEQFRVCVHGGLVAAIVLHPQGKGVIQDLFFALLVPLPTEHGREEELEAEGHEHQDEDLAVDLGAEPRLDRRCV